MGENVYHLYNRVPHLVDACYRSEGWCHSSSCSDQQPRGLPGFLLPSSQHPSSGKCRPRLCLPPALCPFVPFRSLCRASLLPFLPPSDSACSCQPEGLPQMKIWFCDSSQGLQ